MKVWVVVAPWDYTTAEVIGVYASEAAAKEAKKESLRDKRISGDWNLNVEITESFVEVA